MVQALDGVVADLTLGMNVSLGETEFRSFQLERQLDGLVLVGDECELMFVPDNVVRFQERVVDELDVPRESFELLQRNVGD